MTQAAIQPDWATLAARIRAAPEYARIPFHERAGEIDGDRQFFFDGGATVFPWADEGIHEFTRLVRGAAEPQEIEPFLRVLGDLPADAVMLELGAGWAFYSIVAGRRLPGARLLLVEANPRLADVARKNLALNGLSHRATLIEAAAWDTHGQPLHFREAGYGSYAHERRGDYAVPSVSVDGLLAGQGVARLHMLHMDVQGAETRVLRGARAALSRAAIDHVFIGTHGEDIHDACRGELIASGYRVSVSIPPSACVSGDGVLVALAPSTIPSRVA